MENKNIVLGYGKSDQGKLPPQNIELEQAVLSPMLFEKSALIMVSGTIKPEIFYFEKHQLIYNAIMELYSNNEAVDIVTVTSKLRKNGKLGDAGGPLYITELSSFASSTNHIETHIRLLQEFYMKRQMIRLGQLLLMEGFSDVSDVFDSLERAQNEMMGLIESVDNGKSIDVKESIKYALEDLDKKMKSDKSLTGVPTPFMLLNQITGGWQRSDLIIIAARPAMGKSALMMALARACAKADMGVAVFSLEMSNLQLTNRLIIQETKVCSVTDLSRGRVSDHQVQSLIQKLGRAYKYNFHIDDTSSISINELRSKAFMLKNEHDIQLIIVDYLQLMNSGGTNKNYSREQEISSISRGLKKLAKELNIPVIALSQLSRAVESRGGDKRPQLSDLRECLPMSEWVYTPTGVVQLKDKPSSIITTSNEGIKTSLCDFIPKKYNSVYHVKTQFGQFKATPNHLVLTGTGWKKVRDLNIDRDVIASPRKIPHANNGCQPHARFLGWMIGNGGLSGTPALIYRKELDTLVKEEVEKFGVTVRYRKAQKCDNVFDTYLSNGTESGSLKNPIMVWLRSLGLEGRTCYNKSIPEIYLGSSDETHIDLLKGLWESDGTVTNGKAKYTTVSETLARQVAWLLLTIGVRTTIDLYDNLWEVKCSATDNENMEKIVGLKGRFGKLSKPSDRYTDPSPSIFVELMAEMIPDGRKRLQKKANGNYKQISKNRMKEFLEEIPISTIEESPFMVMEGMGWGRINSIEKINEDVRVCDLHVPITNNFITNGVVVHNSGAIEQDADIVCFVHRPEYYGVTEDEEGNSLVGIGELIVAKHRNGSLDTILMKFMKEHTDFVELNYREEESEKEPQQETYNPSSFKSDGKDDFDIAPF